MTHLSALSTTLAMLGTTQRQQCCTICGLSERVCECKSIPARGSFPFPHRQAGIGAAADTVTKGARGRAVVTPESCASRIQFPTDGPGTSPTAGAVNHHQIFEHATNRVSNPDHPLHGEAM